MKTHTVDLSIEGMTCASCARRVEQRLDGLDGVDSASVNLATEQATVTSALDVSQLIEAVEAIGYGAKAPADADAHDPHASHDHHHADASRPGARVAACGLATIPVVVLSMGGLDDGAWRWVVAVLATAVAIVGAWPIHVSAARGLRHRSVGMDTLVSIGVLAAWGWSAAVLLTPLNGARYFESAAVITTLVLVGRLLEHRAKRDAGAAMRALLDLRPRTAQLVEADGTEREIPAAQLAVGDRFAVLPGASVATDGVVETGSSAVDASMVTGESLPVEIGPGDEVLGGTGNTNGRLVVRATRVGSDTALARIARLVQEAQRGTAPVQRLADRVSAVFTPVVLALAALTLGAWLITGSSLSDAIAPAVAVLIVACPCALGLATPTALLVGTGRGAQLGLLIKGPQVLEQTRRIDVALLDKTGTLTTGRMHLAGVTAPAPADADVALARAAAVEGGSEHPIARAVVAGAAERGLAVAATPDDATAEPGTGVRGTVDGVSVWVRRPGAAGPLDDVLAAAVEQAEQLGRTAVVVGWDETARAVLAIGDTVRPESARALDDLRALGVEPVLVTGDNERAARALAHELGITEVVAGVLPEGKVDEVARRQAEGRVVAMVGDGVNDAAALATADLGIAVGSGTDVALESGDIALLTSDPRGAAAAIRLSRRTLAVIKGNLFWAFAYNVVAIPLAMAGALDPMIASATMAFSSIFVVTNSLRLRRFER